MALTDGENGMVMPVAPMYGGGNNSGFGFGNDWGWIILLLLFAGGGWGNGFGNGGFNNALGYDFPWLINGQQGINANTNAGFNQAATQSALGDLSNAVTTGFGNVQTSLCSGFAGVNATVNGAQSSLAQQMYSNQIADLERSFAAQTAATQGMTALQSQFADCCCENRLANCQTQNIIQNEGNATRFADANNTRDLLTNQTANTQAILDKLCQLEIDAKNDKISDLERQLTMANLAASQGNQTAAIIADNNAQTRDLIQRIAPYPIPSYSVANPYTYSGTCGCGCSGSF